MYLYFNNIYTAKKLNPAHPTTFTDIQIPSIKKTITLELAKSYTCRLLCDCNYYITHKNPHCLLLSQF